MTFEHKISRDLLPYAEAICKERGWKITQAFKPGASAAVFEVDTKEELRALKIYLPKYLRGSHGAVTRSRFKIVTDNLLNHTCSHLVQVYEGGDVRDTLFMLMERVPGKPLTDVLKLVPGERIGPLLAQVALAAKFLEDKCLCHRDIKSDNIVVADDFSHLKLLDVGVIRWLDEEKGAGTDDNGQLPFVATARYSSPEYMFRLMPPGPELWRALTFYQLGTVLYDMLVGEPIFEEIVKQSSENRYLIAHAVATILPTISARADAPIELITLAQLALQKDASSRLRNLQWDDFLGVDQQRSDELVLGIGVAPLAADNRLTFDIRQCAESTNQALDRRFTARRIHCAHQVEIETPAQATIHFSWTPMVEGFPPGATLTSSLTISVSHGHLSLFSQARIEEGGSEVVTTPKAHIVDLALSSPQMFESIEEQGYRACLKVAAEAVRNFTERKIR